MISQIAVIVVVRECQSKCQSMIPLFLSRHVSFPSSCPPLSPPPSLNPPIATAFSEEVILVVSNGGANPGPVRSPLSGLSLRVEERLHAIVELTIGLLKIDEVESVLLSFRHVPDLFERLFHFNFMSEGFNNWTRRTLVEPPNSSFTLM